MNTSRKLNWKTLTLATIILFAFASCNTVEVTENIAEAAMERVDMEITGDMEISDFRQSAQDDETMDIVSYGYYGNPSANFDFVINLDSGLKLIISVHDEMNMNPWRQIDQPYHMFPAEDLADKLQYVSVSFETSDGTLYANGQQNNIAQEIMLDVFKITSFDGNQIQCRMRDMKLFNSNADQHININGTFVGAVTFE